MDESGRPARRRRAEHPERTRNTLPHSLRDRGQAAAEFAIALPFAVIAALAIGQVALVVRDQLAVELAAREAARAAAASGAAAVSGAAAAAGSTEVQGISVTVSDDGTMVTATAVKASVAALPLVGLAVHGLQLESSVSMTIEPP